MTKTKKRSFRVPVGPLAEGQRFGRTSDDSFQFEMADGPSRGPQFDDRESALARTAVDRWLFTIAWVSEIQAPTADPAEVVDV